MDIIIEIFRRILNHNYKWFIIVLLALLVLFFIFLLIPYGKKKDQKEVKEESEKEVKEETIDEVQSVEETQDEVLEEPKTLEETAEEKPVEETQAEEEKAEEQEMEAPQKEEEKDEKKGKTLGKWVIKKKSDEDYILVLIANNGEIILASESHNTVASAKNCLATLIKNIENNYFQLHSDKKEQYFFKLKDGGNKLLAMGQIYSTKKSALNSINSVKRFYKAELSEDVVEDVLYTKYQPKEDEELGERESYRGKWIIKKSGDVFKAELRASNGELILMTENYSSLKSVYSAIEIIKKNAIEGNFVIDCDKNNNYFYRLRNVNKLTLVIGETYSKISAVNSSIESVRKFCNSEIFE